MRWQASAPNEEDTEGGEGAPAGGGAARAAKKEAAPEEGEGAQAGGGVACAAEKDAGGDAACAAEKEAECGVAHSSRSDETQSTSSSVVVTSALAIARSSARCSAKLLTGPPFGCGAPPVLA